MMLLNLVSFSPWKLSESMPFLFEYLIKSSQSKLDRAQLAEQ